MTRFDLSRHIMSKDEGGAEQSMVEVGASDETNAKLMLHEEEI